MSHENTITVEVGGRHYIIPTVVGGKQLSNEAAIESWKKGQHNAVGVFDSAEEAEDAARRRSHGGGLIKRVMP